MLTEIKQSNLKDKAIDSLLQSADPLFIEIFQKIINSLIYPRIDSLSGEVLDLLAWQFHIEGWELAETEEEKRALIKKAIELHRYKGTPWAVKEAIRALNIDARLYEWFEDVPYPFNLVINMSKEPYKFSILALVGKLFGTDSLGPELQRKLIQFIEQFKNERSHLDVFVVGAQWHAGRALAGGLMSPFDIRRQDFKTESAYQIYSSVAMACGFVSNICVNEIYMEAI